MLRLLAGCVVSACALTACAPALAQIGTVPRSLDLSSPTLPIDTGSAFDELDPRDWGPVGDSPTVTVRDGDYLMYWPPLTHETAAPPYPAVCYLYGAADELNLERLHEQFLDFVSRTGWVLIVPRYQWDTRIFEPSTWQAGAEARLEAAGRDYGELLDPDRFAIVGRSIGGLIGMKMAARGVPGVPPPKALVLHDGAGFEFSPLLATNPWEAADGFRTADYDDFTGMPRDVQLLALVARESWETAWDAEAAPPPEIGFGNENVGGVLSRAAWTTPRRLRRHFLVVEDIPFPLSFRSSDHGAPVEAPEYADVYWKHTTDILAAAFAGESYVPDLSGRYPVDWWSRSARQRRRTVPEVTRLDRKDIPPPLPFAWNCAAVRELLEVGAAFGYAEPAAFLDALPCE